MRSTLAQALASRIPEVLNISPTDARCTAFINEAERRMLMRGKYWGTCNQYVVSVSSQLMTLPPQIDTIEAIAVSRQPLPVRDFLWQYLRTGWGTRDTTLPNGSGIPEALMIGNYPTAVDCPTTGSTLTVKCDVAADVGKQVLLLGLDVNGNWVRTLVGGVWQDGELVAMAQGAGTNSATTFSRVTGVQPPSGLSGQWWLYAGGIAGTLLSNYQWWEFAPSYKRYLIPFLNTTVTTVEVAGKIAWYPVANNSDYLPVGNLDALKLACMAVKAEEETDLPRASILWNGGYDRKTGLKIIGVIDELNLELDHHQGSGRQVGINVQGSNIGDIEPIPALL